MKKIYLFLLLSIYLFSCQVTLENKKSVLKLERDGFKMLFVPAKYYNVVNLERIIYTSDGRIQFGKAEDINFINHNLKYLRENGLLKKDMGIFRPDIYKRQIHPTTSNFMLSKEDSLYSFDNKNLRWYFILRQY